MARVTVVNDNAEFLDLMHEVLEDERYETTTIDGDREDAIDLIRASRPDLLMVDLRMGTDSLHGWEIAQNVRRDPAFRGLPVLVCSADPVALVQIESDLAETQRTAAITKPFSIDEITQTVDTLLSDPAVQ